jgi:hypothetical protein
MHPSIHPSVRQSVRPSIHSSVFHFFFLTFHQENRFHGSTNYRLSVSCTHFDTHYVSSHAGTTLAAVLGYSSYKSVITKSWSDKLSSCSRVSSCNHGITKIKYKSRISVRSVFLQED